MELVQKVEDLKQVEVGVLVRTFALNRRKDTVKDRDKGCANCKFYGECNLESYIEEVCPSWMILLDGKE